MRARPRGSRTIDWEAAAAELDRDGVVHLPRALDEPAVADVEAGYAWSLANPSPKAVRFYADEEATFFEDTGQHHLDRHGGAGTMPGMRRRTLSLRFLGPDVAFDGRPRDEVGAQQGNDAALTPIYGQLQHGDAFHRTLGPPI